MRVGHATASLVALAAAMVIGFRMFSCHSAVTGTAVSYHSTDVVQEWDLHAKCFTQGFARVNESHVLLSCGGYGASQLVLLWGFESGNQSLSHRVVFKSPSSSYFFEGMTVVNNTIYVLTWKEKLLLEISYPDFTLLRKVPYSRDGWGLAHDPHSGHLYTTDGSSSIYVLDPSDGHKTIRTCTVTLSHDGSKSVSVPYLNELEFVGDLLFANVFIPHVFGGVPNYVVGVDPKTCEVRKILPLFGYGKAASREDSNYVMNGIGKIGVSDLLLTGKMWTKMFRVKYGAEPVAVFHPHWQQYNITSFVSSVLDFS